MRRRFFSNNKISVIKYLSTDLSIVTPYNRSSFDKKIKSNTYSDTGVIEFYGILTLIGDDAFYNCSSLTSITIPNSVTSISNDAFRYCSSLTSITIPDSVTTIGYAAFSGCGSLTSVTIPDSVTEIGERAFSGCIFTKDKFINNSSLNAEENNYWGASVFDIIQEDGLCINGTIAVDCRQNAISVTIPNSVTSISNDAFRYCSSLTSITIPNSVTSIGNYAFEYCTSLTSVNIPDSVTEIGEHAFAFCRSLTNITIPDSVTTIGDAAFFSCTSLKEVYYNGDLSAWYKIHLVHPHSNPMNNGAKLYLNGVELTEVTIPSDMSAIKYTFTGCTSLKRVTIPDSVILIVGDAFRDCSSLKEVYCKPATPPSGGGRDMFNGNASGRKIYVPRASVSAYKTAKYWSAYADVIVGYNF